jgi:hypothetical protein
VRRERDGSRLQGTRFLLRVRCTAEGCRFQVRRTGHAHVHAPKREGSSQPFSPEVLRRASVDALERVEIQNLPDEGGPQHGK